MFFNPRYPPVVNTNNQLKHDSYRNKMTSMKRREKVSNSNRPFIERSYYETRCDPKIRTRFSKKGQTSPYYPKPMKVNVRVSESHYRQRLQPPPGRTRRKAPIYNKRVVEGPLAASSSEFLAESYPNFRSHPDREMLPSVADEKLGSIFIHSAPLSMNPMSMHSAETSERVHDRVKRYVADRRVTAGTASNSIVHAEEAHDLLTPVPTMKEHRASRVISPSSIKDTSTPLWFGASPLQPVQNQCERRSFTDIPPTPFDMKWDTTAIPPSPAVQYQTQSSTRLRQSGEEAFSWSSADSPHIPLSSHAPLTPVVIVSSNPRASPITTIAARRATRMSFETPEDMETIRGLYRACQRLEEESTRHSSSVETKPSRSEISTTRKKRVQSVTQTIPSTRRTTHNSENTLLPLVSSEPSETFSAKPKINTFTAVARKKRVTQEVPAVRRRAHSTEAPMLPLISTDPSVKMSKTKSPGVIRKHIYVSHETSSERFEFEDDVFEKKLEHDKHVDTYVTKPISRRDSLPERPATRIDSTESERLSVVAASRGSVFDQTIESGEITSLPQPRKTSADNVELPEEEADSPSVWLESRTGTKRGDLENVPYPPPSTESPYVPASEPPPSKEKRIDEMSPREFTIQEILSTEIEYGEKLEKLQSILRNYVENKTSVTSTMLAKEALQEITQLSVLAKSLLPKLQAEEQNADSVRRVGKVFETFGHFFKMYDRYMQKCEDFMKFFHRALENQPATQSAMSSLLIAPVQRIPRYELLLRDLLKRTETSHVDYSSIERALDIVKKSTGQIDTHMEELQQKDGYRYKFYERFRNTYVKDQTTCVPELRMPLDPNRCLVKSGKLDKVNRKGRTNTMEFFLLEHLIAYAAEGAGRLTRAIPLSTVRLLNFSGEDEEEKTSRNRRYRMSQSSIVSNESNESSGSIDYDTLRKSIKPSDRERAFALINPAPIKSFVVFASDKYEKNAWIEAIQEEQKSQREREDLHRKAYLTTGRTASLKHFMSRRTMSQSSIGVDTPMSTGVGAGIDTPLSKMTSPAGSFYDLNIDQEAAIQNHEKRVLFVPNTKKCMVCHESFTWMRRPHHCRNCGKCICHSCSPTKLEIRPGDGQVRVCVTCYVSLVA